MSLFPCLVQDIFPYRAKHFLVTHTVTYRQWDSWGPSFTLRWAESTLAAKYNRDMVWLCLSSYLCSISLTATPTQPCVTAMSYQAGRSCPLPGVPVVVTLSGKFYASLKGHAVRENTFWLEKKHSWRTALAFFLHFWVGPSQKHTDFQFFSAPRSICLRDLLQSTAIAKHFRQRWVKPGSKETRDIPSHGLNFTLTSNAVPRLLHKTESGRKMNSRVPIIQTT